LKIPNLNVLAKSNNDVTRDDINQYLSIIKESGSDIANYSPEVITSHSNKLNTALQKIGELNKYYPTAKGYKGKGVKFLSSNPKVFMDRLKILLAEINAGNNNVFNEISAISDKLRRSGAFLIKQLKNLHKNYIR